MCETEERNKKLDHDRVHGLQKNDMIWWLRFKNVVQDAIFVALEKEFACELDNDMEDAMIIRAGFCDRYCWHTNCSNCECPMGNYNYSEHEYDASEYSDSDYYDPYEDPKYADVCTVGTLSGGCCCCCGGINNPNERYTRRPVGYF